MGRGVGIPEARLRTNSVREKRGLDRVHTLFGGEQRGNAARNVAAVSRAGTMTTTLAESQGLLRNRSSPRPIADRAPF